MLQKGYFGGHGEDYVPLFSWLRNKAPSYINQQVAKDAPIQANSKETNNSHSTDRVTARNEIKQTKNQRESTCKFYYKKAELRDPQVTYIFVMVSSLYPRIGKTRNENCQIHGNVQPQGVIFKVQNNPEPSWIRSSM